MKRHFIEISIENLPDDINQSVESMPDNLKVSLASSCSDFTCALLLTTLIRRLAHEHPIALELHQYMLTNDYFPEV